MTRAGSFIRTRHPVAAFVADLALALHGDPLAAASSNRIGPDVRASGPDPTNPRLQRVSA
jgi:hypothetical protein